MVSSNRINLKRKFIQYENVAVQSKRSHVGQSLRLFSFNSVIDVCTQKLVVLILWCDSPVRSDDFAHQYCREILLFLQISLCCIMDMNHSVDLREIMTTVEGSVQYS